jgi:hypothetical protein
MKDFTAQQREVVARKLGYDGPMQGFDEFIASSPALEARYSAITGKFAERMASGGFVKIKKFEDGGDASNDGGGGQGGDGGTGDAASATGEGAVGPGASGTGNGTGDGGSAPGGDGGSAPGGGDAGGPNDTTTGGTGSDTTTGGTGNDTTTTTTTAPALVAPEAGKASQTTATQITGTAAQNIATTNRAGAVVKGTAPTAVVAKTVEAPTPITASTYTADKAETGVTAALTKVEAAQGTVGEKSQITAQTMEPTSTAVEDVKAAQLDKAQTVQGAPTRTLQEEEKVSSAVDMAKAEALATKTAESAAQGTVTEEMTVQGQLTKLTKDFDAKNPPPWAAGALRAVTAEMSARGLGASSLAGAALIQAALEKALPIASADAAVFQQMGLQNLSNKQQTAVLAAQQRAAFLGQEFDQAFQSKVTNAAKVSDVANITFNAAQQIALENSKMAQTVDLANLSNEQALVMANAAQIANLETANLTNEQQAAVENAKSFLAMDMANLSNKQQTALFKGQSMVQTILSDTAASNASKQFNATSENQTKQFNASLSTQVKQFNATQQNSVAMFNTDQASSMSKFNAEVENQRESFNATQRLVIDQANAAWQREISTANTAATNAANNLNAQLTQGLTVAEYNNKTQLYRDTVSFAWQSGQNDLDRANKIATSSISAQGQTNAVNAKSNNDLLSTVAKAALFFL